MKVSGVSVQVSGVSDLISWNPKPDPPVKSKIACVGWALPTVNSRDWLFLVGYAHPTILYFARLGFTKPAVLLPTGATSPEQSLIKSCGP